MKFPVAIISLTLFSLPSFAQEFKINASANLSTLSDFNSEVYIVDQFVVPGWIDVNNSAIRR